MVLYGFLVLSSCSPFFYQPKRFMRRWMHHKYDWVSVDSTNWVNSHSTGGQIKTHFSNSCWVQYGMSSPYLSSLPWLYKGAVPQHLQLVRICPCCNPSLCYWRLLLLFPPHEATLSVAICSGVLTNCRLFAFICGVIFQSVQVSKLTLQGAREAPVERAGMHWGWSAGGKAGLQWSLQTCCWESLIPPVGPGLLGTAATVPDLNAWPQLCFQKHQLSHKRCSDAHETAAKPPISSLASQALIPG